MAMAVTGDLPMAMAVFGATVAIGKAGTVGSGALVAMAIRTVASDIAAAVVLADLAEARAGTRAVGASLHSARWNVPLAGCGTQECPPLVAARSLSIPQAIRRRQLIAKQQATTDASSARS